MLPTSMLLAMDTTYAVDQVDGAPRLADTGATFINQDTSKKSNTLDTGSDDASPQNAAEERSDRHGPYIGLEAGLSFLSDSKFSGTLDGFEVSFDTGFSIGAALGYKFTKHFRLEADLGYRQSDVDKITGFAVPLGGSGDMSTLTVLGNAYYDFDLGIPIVPYIGVGIGLGVVDVNTSDSANRVSVNDSATTFAWNLMAGISYGLFDNVDLDLGYRYLGAIDPELDATFAPVGIFGERTDTVNVDVDIHEIFLGMRYTF
jgi:opacity protein-like surface antigen